MRRLRDLSGRSSHDMIRLLANQLGTGLTGARVARDAARGAVETGLARERLASIEHAGDTVRADLVTTLAHSLVAPFDREDMFRVSRSIDDVLDNVRDFARELDLFRAPAQRCVPVIDAVVDSLALLGQAISAVGTGRDGLHDRTLAAKKSCNEIRRAYECQLAELLSGEVTVTMLRQRELLRRLDIVGLRLGEATDALADAAIKRTM